MNENFKTLGFVVVAVALVSVALLLQQGDDTYDIPDDISTRVFANFDDPLKATSLEIVKYDENLDAPQRFRIAQINGDWTIPSHSGYPADASLKIAQVANSLIHLEILGVATDAAGDHAEFGVVEPDNARIKAGQSGIGTLVVMQDLNDQDLARLIIGKAVQDQPGIRYVRRAGQDRVYRVALDTTHLSTRFEDWIETDLLQVQAASVKNLILNDYTSQIGLTNSRQLGIEIPRNSTITVQRNLETGVWEPVQLIRYEGQQPVEFELTDQQQLNSDKLNALTTGLAELRIVDVERKPEGMSSNLRSAGSIFEDQHAIHSLMERGFFFGPLEDDQARLYSSEGELIAGTDEGVQYVLRFGKIASVTATGDTSDETSDEGAEGTGSSVNRYLFVMAEFNPDLIPKPVIKELPGASPETESAPAEEPAETETMPENQPVEAPTSETPAVETPAPAETTEPEAIEAEAPAESEGESVPMGGDDTPAADAEPSTESPVDAAAEASDDTNAEAAPESAPAETEMPTDAVTPAETNMPAEGEVDPAFQAPATLNNNAAPATEAVTLDSLRRAVEAENRRNQREYDEKIAAGKQKVEQLNARFADWYYVIPDETYQKIHLSFDDIIATKPSAAPAGAQSENPPIAIPGSLFGQ